MNDTNPVVNSSPSHSVLGRIVTERFLNCLELLRWIAIERKLARAVADLQATIEAERTERTRATRETLFSFAVGNDIEPSSGKSAWDICVETLERIQYLNERIALHGYPEERIERSGKFYYFLIRLAGIAGGQVAASKFMDDPRNDRRVRDYLVEDRCPNYLVESITLSDGEEALSNEEEAETKTVRSEVNWFQTMVTVQVGVRQTDAQANYKKKTVVRVVPLRETFEHSHCARTKAASPHFWVVEPEAPKKKKFASLPPAAVGGHEARNLSKPLR
jgi:hypothetical protein